MTSILLLNFQMIAIMKIEGELSIEQIEAMQFDKINERLLIQSTDGAYYAIRINEKEATVIIETMFARSKVDLRPYTVNYMQNGNIVYKFGK